MAGGNFRFTMAGGDNGEGSSTDKGKATGNISQHIINAETPDVPTDDAINDYINERIQYYIELGDRDDWLWDDFRADFAKWTSDDFAKISSNGRGKLRNFLRLNGVYVAMPPTVVPDALTAVLDEAKPMEWSDLEVEAAVKRGNFNSWRNPTLPGALNFILREEEERKAALSTSP